MHERLANISGENHHQHQRCMSLLLFYCFYYTALQTSQKVKTKIIVVIIKLMINTLPLEY